MKRLLWIEGSSSLVLLKIGRLGGIRIILSPSRTQIDKSISWIIGLIGIDGDSFFFALFRCFVCCSWYE